MLLADGQLFLDSFDALLISLVLVHGPKVQAASFTQEPLQIQSLEKLLWEDGHYLLVGFRA